MKSVFVAMSGGVDSSVAAALLKKEGYKVTGVFFKPWAPEGFVCNWKEDRLDAMRVCAKLDIPFKTWDFSSEYGKSVAQYMIKGYKDGVTPNPDVMCNKEIKFGLFLKKALSEGANYIATGHYARILKSKTGNMKLLKARDTNKDQTYFLWTLTQNQLRQCLFPIGEYTKPQVRKLAKKFGLPTHNKKDSQGVCFVGELNMHDFLSEYIKPKKGDIIFEGKKIGTHDGAAYYTIGQRHGLDIKTGGGPYYVTQKVGNTLHVQKSKIKSQNAKICDLNWISAKKLPLEVGVKIRYRASDINAQIKNDKTVVFEKPAESVAPGQSIVFYKGSEILGGGIIQSFQ